MTEAVGFAARTLCERTNTHCCERIVSQGLCRAARSTRKVSRGAFKVSSSVRSRPAGWVPPCEIHSAMVIRRTAGRLSRESGASAEETHRARAPTFTFQLHNCARRRAKFAFPTESCTDGATVQLVPSGAGNCSRSGVDAANLLRRSNWFLNFGF